MRANKKDESCLKKSDSDILNKNDDCDDPYPKKSKIFSLLVWNL